MYIAAIACIEDLFIGCSNNLKVALSISSYIAICYWSIWALIFWIFGRLRETRRALGYNITPDQFQGSLLSFTCSNKIIDIPPHSKHLEKFLLGIEQPRYQNYRRPCKAHDAAKDLHIEPAFCRILKDGSTDRGHSEGGDRDGKKDYAQSVANLGQRRHRDGKGARKTYERSWNKAEHDGKADGDGRVFGGDPDGELGDSGEAAGDDEHIPSSDSIGAITRGQTTKETWNMTVNIPLNL